jgi:hypothetical protein
MGFTPSWRTGMAWKRIALFSFPAAILAMLWADVVLLRLVALQPGSSFLWMSSDLVRGPVFPFINFIQHYAGYGENYILFILVVSIALFALSISKFYRGSGFLFSHLLTLGFFFSCADKFALSAALYPDNIKVSFDSGFFSMMHIEPSQILLIAFGVATCAVGHLFFLADRSRREVALKLLELQRF